MTDRYGGDPDATSGGSANGEEQPSEEAERSELEVVGRGVRTALRNNATAYGFSISITAAYGLVTGAHGTGSALDTLAFAFGAALAFVLVGAFVVTHFPHGRLPEGGQVATFAGGVDVLTIFCAVLIAFGLSRIGGFTSWPLTAFGTVLAYLFTGGLNVLLARKIAQRTSLGRSQ